MSILAPPLRSHENQGHSKPHQVCSRGDMVWRFHSNFLVSLFWGNLAFRHLWDNEVSWIHHPRISLFIYQEDWRNTWGRGFGCTSVAHGKTLAILFPRVNLIFLFQTCKNCGPLFCKTKGLASYIYVCWKSFIQFHCLSFLIRKQKLIHLGIRIAVITNYIYEADLLKALYLQIKIKWSKLFQSNINYVTYVHCWH